MLISCRLSLNLLTPAIEWNCRPDLFLLLGKYKDKNLQQERIARPSSQHWKTQPDYLNYARLSVKPPALSIGRTVKEKILYHSTNRELIPDSGSLAVPFKGALFEGLAPDGGLFMPQRIPRLSPDNIKKLKGAPYRAVAETVLLPFLQTEMDADTLAEIVEQAYDFDVPIQRLDPDTHLVRLDGGPTASFKDFAAQFMALVMSHFRPEDFEITVLVATSGDTGSAVGEAYRGLDGFRVIILYPEREVSDIQRLQLEAIGKNVRAVSVSGKFDDCQNLVKQAFNDPDLRWLNLTSANSINIGRLLPQIVYYVYAYVNTADDFEPAVFSVPSGNFGNSLGCEFARRMGLPVEKLIIAVNENDEFPRFLETGQYRKVEPSRECLSNAMNVGNPSNLARYFDLYGGILTEEGVVKKQPDIEAMRKHLFSVSVSDASTVGLIKELYENLGFLVEPHGAVGVSALRRFRAVGNSTPAVCLETAHPGKFSDLLEDILHIPVDLPDSVKRSVQRKRSVDRMENDYLQLKDYLMEAS